MPSVATALLRARGLGLDALDAQLLLLHALGKPSTERPWLIAHGAEPLHEAVGLVYRQYLRRRLENEPLPYIVGYREFYGLTLQVDRRVLVPRPDTEILVDWALQLLRDKPAATVIDLGTGSGALALALKHQRPDLQVSALDASPDALAVARGNAKRLALDVRFVEGHWLREVSQRFDLILSNPPYVRQGDPHLDALNAEPLQALVSEADGLGAIREIAAAAPHNLAPGGWLLLEHGYDQAQAVRHLLRAAAMHGISTRRDLAGIERCSAGRVD